MTSYDIDPLAVQRALRMAEHQVRAALFPPRSCEVRPRTLKMLRAAIVLAWPDMDAENIADAMSVDDASPYVFRDSRQFTFWWSPDAIVRMADVLNPDRVPPKPKRAVKPLPADLDLTGLPLCGQRRPGAVEVVRRRALTKPVRPPQPIVTAAPWDPAEARRPLRAGPRRAISLGDPPHERSALYAKLNGCAEVTA